MAARRPIDDAMHADRAAKATVRKLWVEVVRRRKTLLPPTAPIYLTLPGAAGLDLKLLIQEGLISATESGAIADIDNKRIIAIEKDSIAVLDLQVGFPGLKIIESNFFNMLRGASPITFPTGHDREAFTAGVINLDLNDPLVHRNGLYPTIEAIVKIARLQAAASPRHDWTLLLTCQGEISWPAEAQLDAQRFLVEQCDLCPPFDEGCKKVLGPNLYGRLRTEEAIAMQTCTSSEQQNLLLTFVPAQIARRVYTHGWRVETTHALRYGGGPGVAPMTTWILDFVWDPRASGTPHAVLVAALAGVLERAGHIDSKGDLVLL